MTAEKDYMRIEKVSISECSEGDILATDVLNKNGVILVAKDTVMNEYIKERLIELGIESVNIYYSLGGLNNRDTSYIKFKRDYKEIAIETKNIIQGLVAGKPLNYKDISNICNKIYKNINQNNNIIRCMAEIKSVDNYTYNHCVNVAFYSMLIGKWLYLSDIEINYIIQSGLLHDIGKSKIPSEILNKGGILTKEEYEIIKGHTTLGYRMVEDIHEIDSDIKKAILQHHERIDGSGYPFSISKNRINLYARIVAVADVFDAMTSDRAYKKKVTPFETFEMFQTVGIGIFDTKVLKTFLKNIAAHLVGANVLLNNGEIGEVIFVPLHNLTSPIVKVSKRYLDISRENDIKILSMI